MTWHSIWHNLGQEPGLYVWRTGGAVLVVILTFIAGRVVNNRVRGTLRKTRIGPNPTVLVARTARLGAYFFGLLWVLALYGVPFTALAAFASVFALALTFALQDLFKSLIAGVYLLAERPFNIGDQITASGVTGVIDDIQMRVTHLHGPQGEHIVMPNQVIFSQVVVNNTVAGNHSTSLDLQFPKSLDPTETGNRVLEAMATLPSVGSEPKPRIKSIGLTPELTKWRLWIWLVGDADISEVVLALGKALPEITIDISAA